MAKKVHALIADQPIELPGQDTLGRRSFAESLGEAISGWDHEESLVMALFGSWGAGKSSIVNLCINHLSTQTTLCPTVIRFNPWLLNSTDGLISAFFKDLEIGIRRSSNKRQWAKITKSLNRFHLAILAVPMIAAALHASGAEHSVILQWLIAAGVGKFVNKENIDALDKVVKETAEQTKTQAEQLSLFEVKEDVVKLLRSLKKPILVIIDDIDRLPREQIRMIVQLVKVTADFPNIIYLLCFHRKIVEEALTEGTVSGREYLEKIVQVAIDIPEIEPVRLQTLLETDIVDVFHTRRISVDTLLTAT